MDLVRVFDVDDLADLTDEMQEALIVAAREQSADLLEEILRVFGIDERRFPCYERL
ncbi:MAG: hypothetical protein HY675_08055 [Chloroflexi bacterium]|nr:hypothetical protein [Chloroflexota bacterium]